MKCLSLPALHIICQENFVFGCMNDESTFPQRDFARIVLNCLLISDSAVALPLHQVHGTLHGIFLKTCCAAASIRIKKINEVVHQALQVTC